MTSLIWKVLSRKKVFDNVATEESRLARVLNTFDLTALGVGSTLGVGVYVLAGKVARDIAGPAVVLSFLVAAVASLFAGLCYAEFGARVPRAGSAYIYSYVCIGELVAFIIGWNLILEYVIGAASVARGFSSYLDTLLNNTLNNTFSNWVPIHVPYMSPYFDLLAFTIPILLAITLAFGLKESALANNVITSLNIAVVLFVIIAGSIKADTANWYIDPKTVNNTGHFNLGQGGFFPFGLEGVIKGAATCFYGFVGFDCIATTGEEVKNPKRAIPISVIISLFIIFLAYFGISTVLTLMVPYYLQDPDAPIPSAFESVGWIVPKWIVAFGGLCGLMGSLFGAMFPLPRIIYAMSNDSLLFKFLGKVSERFKTPVVGTLLAGLLTGIMAAIFDLSQLVSMMSIGTLLAYTIVAASVLLLRYSVDKTQSYLPIQVDSDDNEVSNDEQNILNETSENENAIPTCKGLIRQMFNFEGIKVPTRMTETLVILNLCLYCILCVIIGLCAIYLNTQVVNGTAWSIIVISLVLLLLLMTIISIATQPMSRTYLSFKVPLVPLVPALSIIFNIYLMLMLDTATWIRFGVWMAVGFSIYGFYGLPNSLSEYRNYERLE